MEGFFYSGIVVNRNDLFLFNNQKIFSIGEAGGKNKT